jgi:hypothetical protein
VPEVAVAVAERKRLSLEQRLRRALDHQRAPNPRQAVREVATTLAADEAEYLIERGLMEIVRGIYSSDRQRRPMLRAVDRAKDGTELSLARIVVWYQGEYRWLGDCDAEFLLGSASEDREQARALSDTADRKERVAHALMAHGVARACDLAPDVLRAAWEGSEQ